MRRVMIGLGLVLISSACSSGTTTATKTPAGTQGGYGSQAVIGLTPPWGTGTQHVARNVKCSSLIGKPVSAAIVVGTSTARPTSRCYTSATPKGDATDVVAVPCTDHLGHTRWAYLWLSFNAGVADTSEYAATMDGRVVVVTGARAPQPDISKAVFLVCR